MSEYEQPIEPEYWIEKKSLYYKKIDFFKKHWDTLGRKIVLSERMSHFHQDIDDPTEIRKQYHRRVVDLLCILDHSMFVHNSADPQLFEELPQDNEQAFEQFKEKNIHNPEYTGKYVAFVHGILQGVGNVENQLVKEMHQKFGNVPMFIDKIIAERKTKKIKTPYRK